MADDDSAARGHRSGLLGAAVTTVAHLSDLHFGKADPDVARGLLADLARAAPDLVVVSGDLTERALDDQFAAARDFLARLPAPWLAVPGNHDVAPLSALRERLTTPLERYRRHVSADLAPLCRLPGLSVIGFNSAHGATWKNGRATPAAVQRSCEAADGTGDDVTMLVAHHPFLAPEDRPRAPVIAGAEAALRRFADSGIDLVLGGHAHRAYTGRHRARHPEAAQDVLVVQASTAISRHLRDQPNGYNLLTVSDEAIALDVRHWLRGGFETTRTGMFPRRAFGRSRPSPPRG